MKMRLCTVHLLLISITIFMICDQSFGEGIKDRMKSRLPVIAKLKQRGILGENNLGYLEFVSGKRENVSVVESENRDRRAVYKEIAKKYGSTTKEVGKRRSLKIYQKARPGTWLKDQNDRWYRKR